jgi:AAA+ superfamily predicted ATPase
MAEEFEILYEGTIQRFINDELEMQVSETGVETVHGRFNDLIKRTIRDAEKTARDEDRKRILIRHLEEALEKNLGDRTPEPPELMEDIRQLGPIEIGDLVKLINNYVDELKSEGSE